MVFKNKEVLDINFLPDTILFRENEIKILAENIENNFNTFVFGKPGIGKTLISKFVMKEAFEKLGFKTFYINGFFKSSSYSILQELLTELGFIVPQKSLSFEFLVERFLESVKNKDIVICLDEVDIIEDKLLYILSRVKEKIRLILICNKEEFFYNLDGRIRSSLMLDKLELKPYSLNQLKEIIEWRLKKAFFDYEEGISLFLAGVVNKFDGDLRIAWKILLKAGLREENSLSKTLRIETVKKIFEEEKFLFPRKEILIENSSEIEKEILELLKKSKLTIKEIVEKLDKKISERNLLNYINSLQEKNLVKSFREGNKVFYEADI